MSGNGGHSHNCDEHVTILDGEAELRILRVYTSGDRDPDVHRERVTVEHLSAGDQMGRGD
jgi:hypothetical protein